MKRSRAGMHVITCGSASDTCELTIYPKCKQNRKLAETLFSDHQGISHILWASCAKLWAPSPMQTDGEAANPGPRLRRGGPRSGEARERRINRNTAAVDATSWTTPSLVVWHVNIQGLYSHLAELTCRIKLSENPPGIVCVNETFLDGEAVEMQGYSVVSRRDRPLGKQRGGVIVFASDAIAAQVTEVYRSERAERVWCLVHADSGPLLLCAWYRTPGPTDADGSIGTILQEHQQLADQATGTLIVGDLNLHHARWLRHSSGTSAAAESMRQHAAVSGWNQLLGNATRGKHVLDLALCDVSRAVAKLLPKVADHCVVQVTMPCTLVEASEFERQVWHFDTADWDRLKYELGSKEWPALVQNSDPERGVESINNTIQQAMADSISTKNIRDKQSTHPWINQRVMQAVQRKASARGECEQATRAKECSRIILEERNHWINRQRHELKTLPRGSKAWWRKEKQLQQVCQKQSSIPALRGLDGAWVRESQTKADLLAQTFMAKCKMPAEEANEYSALPKIAQPWQLDCSTLRVKYAQKCLQQLDEDSATGPNKIPAKVLKRCAIQLAEPVYLLGLAILDSGVWPAVWIQHWVAAIYKKKSVFDPKNYRGVHMTAQLTKAMERFFGTLFIERLSAPVVIGPSQFAYIKNRGSRDALAYLVLSWLLSFMEKARVALYCSDVSGAFDKVRAAHLVEKLKSKGMPAKLLCLVASWLRDRVGNVVVTGSASVDMLLRNMVFQGTVWGPILWNVFYEDARNAINKSAFREVVFADDLNGFKIYRAGENNDSIFSDIQSCQQELHKWGKANQVEFDPAKESSHILSRQKPYGPDFKLLGV